MKYLAGILVATLAVSGGGQDAAGPAKQGWVFGGLRLLPGYKTSLPSALDSAWTISKKDGVTIRYTGGNVANIVHSIVRDTEKDGTALWTKEQVLNGRTADVALTKDGRLLISISPFNFEAKVDSIEQATDVLLMVLTYADGEEQK
jgi:hypothetical protein